MNKILKILSILVIGFVMFSCSTPTNDPVEVTPEEPTYSITFVAINDNNKPIADTLNKNSNFKNIKANSEFTFPEQVSVDEWNCEVKVWYYYKKTTGGYISDDRIKSTFMDSNKIIVVEGNYTS